MRNLLYLFFILFALSANAQEGPGGVSGNNVFWVKADVGVTFANSDVAEWTDQSAGGNNATQATVSYRPSYISSLHNYNPGVHFDGSDEHLSINNLVAANSKNINVFAVGTNEQGGDSWHSMVMGQANSSWLNGGYGICGLDGGAYEFGFWVDSYSSHAVSAPMEKDVSILLEGKYSGTQIEFFQNAYLEGTTPYGGVIGDAGTTHLGGGVGTDYNHKGYIAEVAIYDTDLSVLERNKVSSYLAIKYGLTLDKNGVSNQYINSDGVPIYASDNLYWNNIIGIERDDNSSLMQKQSHLENDSTRIYLASLKTRNVSNTGVFSSDKQAVVMGSTKGELHATEATLNDKPSGVFRMLDRTWQVKNTNFDGTFSIDFLLNQCAFVNPISTSDMRLLVDTDGDFSDAQVLDSGAGLSFLRTGNLVSIIGITNAHIPMNATVFITLASLTNPVVTMPYFMTLCPGESMDINGTTYDESNPAGVETLASSLGCDSIVNINLTFGSGTPTNITQTLCSGEELIVNGTAYNAANPSGTELISIGGTCDSVVNIDLTFQSSVATNYTEVFCGGENVIIHNTMYNASHPSGTEILTSSFGCDSIVNVDLTFHSIISMDDPIVLCEGESIEVNGTTYDALNPTGVDTLTAVSGCDSILNIKLQFQSPAITDYTEVLCEGASVIINGSTYDALNPSGTETLTTVSGCDSVVNIQLTFLASVMTSINQSLCEGENIEINGTLYNANNLVGTEILTSVSGCDSIVNINLISISGISVPFDTTICVGTSIELDGQVFDENNLTGVLEYTSVNGCDSIVNIHLSFYDGPPEVLDDVFTVYAPEKVSLNILENDELPESWTIQVLNANHTDYWALNEEGELIVYGDRASSGEELIVTYEVCNEFCKTLCSSGQVNINFEYTAPKPEAIVSEILTLNNDGKNDILFFRGISLSNNEGITIFNRWGDLVFSEFPYHNGWDGKNKKGEDLPDGTYYYILYLNRSEGESILGDVLIVR